MGEIWYFLCKSDSSFNHGYNYILKTLEYILLEELFLMQCTCWELIFWINLQMDINNQSINQLLTVLSTSLGKTFFAWRFILNENILFWLTISYQKPFVFSVSVLCFQICTQKLVIFWNFCLSKYFYFSLLNSNYWCFTTILWKFQKNWTNETC